MSQMNEEPKVVVTEKYFLSKFDGDSTDPKDEVERLEFDKDFNLVAHHKIENGEIVETETF